MRGLIHGEGSFNSPSKVDGIGGRVPNRENGLKSENETDEVGEAQEGSEEGVGQFVGNIYECQGNGSGLGVVRRRWANWAAERKMSF